LFLLAAAETIGAGAGGQRREQEHYGEDFCRAGAALFDAPQANHPRIGLALTASLG
jgi:hypothetical protein